MSPTEKEFQSMVVALARLAGWRVYHTFDSRRSDPGFPDLVMVRDGRLIFAELKSAKGRVAREQTEWLGALERVADACWQDVGDYPIQVFCWRPADWPQIEETLTRRRYG